MKRRMGWRITAVILCLWGAWSIACYQSNDDRCVPGQARCESNGDYASYAENCVESDSGPHLFDSAFCLKRTSSCRITRDDSGSARAFCAIGDALDDRCEAGVFADRCVESGWIRLSLIHI